MKVKHKSLWVSGERSWVLLYFFLGGRWLGRRAQRDPTEQIIGLGRRLFDGHKFSFMTIDDRNDTSCWSLIHGLLSSFPIHSNCAEKLFDFSHVFIWWTTKEMCRENCNIHISSSHGCMMRKRSWEWVGVGDEEFKSNLRRPWQGIYISASVSALFVLLGGYFFAIFFYLICAFSQLTIYIHGHFEHFLFRCLFL